MTMPTGRDPADVEVFAFEKNSQEVVKATLSRYRGETYVSLRVWWRPNGDGDMRPTKKGITVNAGLLPDLKQAVAELEKTLRSRGLLGPDPPPSRRRGREATGA